MSELERPMFNKVLKFANICGDHLRFTPCYRKNKFIEIVTMGTEKQSKKRKLEETLANEDSESLDDKKATTEQQMAFLMGFHDRVGFESPQLAFKKNSIFEKKLVKNIFEHLGDHGFFAEQKIDAIQAQLTKNLDKDADILYAMAEANFHSARIILTTKHLCDILLSSMFSETILCGIAKNHPKSAQLILKTEYLRKKLLPHDSSFITSKCLCEIAQSHPESALFILKTESLSSILLSLSSLYTASFLYKIAVTYPEAAEFILSNDTFRKHLLNREDSKNNEVLKFIARFHVGSKIIQELCKQLQSEPVDRASPQLIL